MKHVVIVAHPNPSSFTRAVADVYVDEVSRLGQSVDLRDLYGEGFDPRLRAQELPAATDFSPLDDILEERTRIRDADVFAFIYPFWFYAPPAILTGYVQRVFGLGFGYRRQIRDGGSQPLLAPRKMISFTSTGSSMEWLSNDASGFALQNMLDQHLADVCGLARLAHCHLGRVLKSTPAQRVEAYFDEVRSEVRRHFAPSTC